MTKSTFGPTLIFLVSILTMMFNPSSWGEEKHFPSYPDISGFNPYYSSRGFRLGYVLNYTNTGSSFWRFHYEGEMMLGFRTSQGPLYESQCYQAVTKEHTNPPATKEELAGCSIMENPWKFSSYSETFFDLYQKIKHGAVVIFYNRPTVAPHAVLLDTKDFIEGIWPVEADLPIEATKEMKLPVSDWLTPEKGFVEGRVISATRENPIRETYKVILQSGRSPANNFRVFSVVHNELFDYIVRTMFTGRLVRVDFVQIFTPARVLSDLRGYKSYDRIYRVTILPDEETELHKETPQP
jgi:hypothetical protein